MFNYIFKTATAEMFFPAVEDRQDIQSIVPILWGEHCVECAMPTCYGTCLMFQKRMDGNRCVRFENGVVPHTKNGEIYSEVKFRKWAKLEAALPPAMAVEPITKYISRAKQFRNVCSALRKFGDIIHYHRISRIFSVITDRKLSKIVTDGVKPDGFYLQVYLVDEENRHLNIEIYDTKAVYFKTSVSLSKGWNETFIPWGNLALDENTLGRRVRLFFGSNETAHVIFKHADFVCWKQTKTQKPAAKVKCVAWDLDNTLWKGVIGDDGPDGVQPNQECIKMIKALDQMGILQTIVSKNEEAIALDKLSSLGLKDYFLYPAINWGRKSENLKSIARELNINIDTFAFIDDQPFERDEVKSSLPQVRVFDVTDISTLLDREEFKIPITEESAKRRLSYQNEYKRKKISANWTGDYESFLKSCKLKMKVFRPVNDSDINRSLELVMRSNQYNISGRKYSVEEFKNNILDNEKFDCFSFKVSDNFGDYGLVGFASFEKDENKYVMHDFVMSCRVAQKTVEQAFFSALFKALCKDYNQVIIPVTKTERNKPLRDVLASMPFLVNKDDDKSIVMTWNLENSFPENEIIEMKNAW